MALYTALVRMSPSPSVALNRAIALQHAQGAAAALAEVDALAGALDQYHLFHATRAELLRALDRLAEASQADARALELTNNPAERDLLSRRLEGKSSG